HDTDDASELGEDGEGEKEVDRARLHGSSSRAKKRTKTREPVKVKTAATRPSTVYALRWKPSASMTSASVRIVPPAWSATSASSRGTTTATRSSGPSSASSAVAAHSHWFTARSCRSVRSARASGATPRRRAPRWSGGCRRAPPRAPPGARTRGGTRPPGARAPAFRRVTLETLGELSKSMTSNRDYASAARFRAELRRFLRRSEDCSRRHG